MSALRQVTLTVITYDDKILLGMKKRGFGKGYWNGFGGKPVKDESLLDCVCRETKEEAGITLSPEDLLLVGILDFHFTNKPADWDQQVHVYKATTYTGRPAETEEMLPKEFSLDQIPYEQMWPDDEYWLPLVLKGAKVRARFTFAEDGSVAKHDVSTVDDFS